MVNNSFSGSFNLHSVVFFSVKFDSPSMRVALRVAVLFRSGDLVILRVPVGLIWRDKSDLFPLFGDIIGVFDKSMKDLYLFLVLIIIIFEVTTNIEQSGKDKHE
jgi:hypothetical protein